MTNTRSMRKKLEKLNTSDNDGSASWSNLNHDLLLLIMMQMGFFDFIAFSGVCKSWRSLAVSNWNKFMVSKQPMCLSISTRLIKKECYLEESKLRKLKTIIPHSNGKQCVGITCGYLIFYGRKTHDFWLVNPITWKQLHFPGFPFARDTFSTYIRGILVYSPSMSGWVFVVSNKFSTEISFSLAGKQARWRYISSCSCIRDLHFFKGKIYMINARNRLWELKLSPEPTLTLLEMKNFPWEDFRDLEFVSSGVNLYVRDIFGGVFIEVDFDEMKWVNSKGTIGEYAVFVSNYVKCGAAIKPDAWTHPWTQYERLNFSRRKKDSCSTTSMWYLPHEFLKDNDPDMENGALLNILED